MADFEGRRSPKRKTPLFSPNRYREHRSEVPLSSLRAQEVARKKRTHRVRGAITIIAVALSLFLIWWMTSISQITTSVSVPKNSPKIGEEATYAQAAKDYLNSTFLAKNSMFLNEEALEKTLQEKFPEIESIKLDASVIGRKLNLKIVQRQPIGVITATNESYLIDSTGVAFYHIPQGFDTAKMATITDDAGLAISNGTQVITTDSARYIAALDTLFTEGNIKVARYIIPRELREVQLQINGEAYVYKLHIDVEPEQSYKALTDTRNYLNSQKIVPSAYVDLRVPNEASYR